ncbi:complement receptor type 1-like [Anoplopoma fimbria]|uniref:complement receptor type 1-like n=1 Tax=Anoplopoma fimbria TaxID=229290 RepID=UPI0023EDA2C8|nr:complement receptor type 1-like [Anoplopoma fimbria]
MRNFGCHFLLLSFAFLASAQVPKKCSAPPEYPNTALGKKYTRIQKFFSGEKVYYECGEDLTPSRGSRAVQCVGGRWTQLTLKCEKKSCGNAGDLPNGEFQYGINSFLGEKVYAICKDGYTLKGLNYMICKKTGWTGELPSCVLGEATCSPPAVANSVKSTGAVSVYRVGDHVNFTCSPGFQLDAAQQITCGPGGLWQPQPPRCMPSPNKTPWMRCARIPQDSNANLADKYFMMTSFAPGDRVHCVCDIGYAHSGGSRYRSCMKGKWTPLLLKCERKACGPAGEIINGEFTYTGVEFGDTATAVCAEGHHLVGPATRNCLSKGWDGRVPACEAAVCAEPPGITNAEMTGPQEPPYSYRTVVRYHCRVGTLIGKRDIWCTKTGTWSDPPPKCREMTCSAPNVANGYWRGAHSRLYQERDTVSIECNRGYTRTGPSTVTCGGDGRWSPRLPRCTPRRTYRRN